MKAQKTLQELSTEELQKRVKILKVSNIVLLVCILLMAAAGLYLTSLKGLSFQTFLPLFFLPMLLVNYMNLKKTKEEIAARDNF